LCCCLIPGGEVDDHGDVAVAGGVAGVGPAVLVDPDHGHSVEASGVGGQQRRGGFESDAVDGVPAAAELAGHRRHGGPVDDQPA
jgi:hypothetical protein